jgi:hypothetical protein
MTAIEAKCSDEWVRVQPGFHLGDAVTDGALRHALYCDLEHIRCGECGQSILRTASVQGRYPFSSAVLNARVIAHCMQAHGWTRETIPNSGEDGILWRRQAKCQDQFSRITTGT